MEERLTDQQKDRESENDRKRSRESQRQTEGKRDREKWPEHDMTDPMPRTRAQN